MGLVFGSLTDLWDSKFEPNMDDRTSKATYNQPLRATVQTCNLGHMMLIQGGTGGSGRGDLQKYD